MYVKTRNNELTERFMSTHINRQIPDLKFKFLYSVLPLRIETGRCTHPPIEKCLCTLCNNNTVEDEIHFALYCPMYDEIRTQLISHIKQRIQCYSSLNNYEKIKVIMHTKPLKFSKCIRDMYVL